MEVEGPRGNSPGGMQVKLGLFPTLKPQKSLERGQRSMTAMLYGQVILIHEREPVQNGPGLSI